MKERYISLACVRRYFTSPEVTEGILKSVYKVSLCQEVHKNKICTLRIIFNIVFEWYIPWSKLNN